MDNKRVYKKISTIFWFMLAILPLLFVIVKFIFMWFVHTDSLNLSDIQTIINSNSLTSAFDSCKSYFYVGVPTFLRTTFEMLLTRMGLNIGASLPSFLSIFMSWFCWVYFIELMIDFVVWLPKLCHSFMERWCAD